MKRLNMKMTIVFLISIVMSSAALAHLSTVDVVPKLILPGESYEFNVTFYNQFSPVDEVRITGVDFFDNFDCPEKEGWELNIIQSKKQCHYVAINETYYLGVNESAMFMFHADISIDANGDCIAQMLFETRDLVSHWQEIHYDEIIIDRYDAFLEKTMFGDHIGDCPPGTPQDECYVKGDGNGGVMMEIFDTGDICPNYDMSCTYEVWWQGELVDSDEFDETASTTFYEDSEHTLIVECIDGFENRIYDEELFLVDNEPPTTTKTYGSPYYPEDINDPGPYPHWISLDTLITLDAVDEKVGVNKTYWRNTVVDEVYCWTPHSGCSTSKPGSGEFVEYTGPFTSSEESCHLIEFYSVDLFGYEEERKQQCVFVDDTPPNITKTIGEPKVVRDELTYITQTTPITLTCEDLEPHPVDRVSLNYRYRVSDDCDDLGDSIFGEWMTVPSAVKASSSVMAFSSTGWGGWSCPEGTVVVDGGYEPEPATSPVEHSLAWEPGACVDEVCWPNTPFGYTYSEGETGWIVQNGGEAQKLQVYAMCVPSFTFEEDSCHELEYSCADALDNTAGPFTEIDIVDTLPPVVNKTIEGPYIYGDCPELRTVDFSCEGDNLRCGDWYPEECLYVDDATTVTITAEDVMPHPVGDVTCTWSMKVYGEIVDRGTRVTPPFDLVFPQESEHFFFAHCEDALHNDVFYRDLFIADHAAPITSKEYSGPMYPREGYPKWINSETEISLFAYDPEPHPSGVNETLYRVSLVADEYCEYQQKTEDVINGGFDCYNAVGDGEFLAYEEAFNIDEDSCHLIEYYSVDNVEKTERVNKQCVYVDNQGPEAVKTVGEPSVEFMWDIYGEEFYPVSERCWNGELDEIECWKTTLLTPLSLECVDRSPHPVGTAMTCFQVGVDGDDFTEDYCEKYEGSMNEGDGYCCVDNENIDPFYFDETTYHNLDYYCVDRLDNVGEIDEEKFKVEETSFEISLNKKWNLISTPVKLLDDSMDEVFDSVKDSVESVWTYDAMSDTWYVFTPDGNPANDNLHTMIPGWGYWVFATQDDKLVIGGSLFSPAMAPPSRQLKGDAWNLVGYYGADGETSYEGPAGNGKIAKCVFFSLSDSMFDIGWSSLLSYWEPYNPYMWLFDSNEDNLDPGAGYWVLAATDGVYAPTTNCVGLW